MYNEILSTALGNRERLLKLISYPSDIFDTGGHVLILDELKLISQKETDIDMGVLISSLKSSGNYDKVSAILDAVMKSGTSVNFDYHIRQLVQEARRREIRLVNKDFDNLEEHEWVAAYDAICDKWVIDDEMCIEMSEMGDMSIDELFPPDSLIPWRLSAMNNTLMGMFRGDLIMIGGEPGVGKTTFVDDEAAHKKTLFFQLEVTRRGMFAKFLSKKTGIHVKKIMANKLSDSEGASINKSKKELKHELNIKLYDKGNTNFNYIRNKFKYEFMTKKYDLAIIDNIQLVNGVPGDNGEAKMSNLTGSLKQMAKDFDIPIMCISHLTKETYTHMAKPKLGSMKGGGSLAQDPDMIIFLYRDENKNVVFECPKDRFGSPGKIGGIGFDQLYKKYIDVKYRFEDCHEARTIEY